MPRIQFSVNESDSGKSQEPGLIYILHTKSINVEINVG